MSSLERPGPIFGGDAGDADDADDADGADGADSGGDPPAAGLPSGRGTGFRVFVGLAIITVAARLVATLATYGWTATGLTNSVEGGLVGSAIVLVPAVLFASRYRGRPSSDIVLVAFALIAFSDVAGSIAGATIVVLRHGSGLASTIYAVVLLGGPALGALTAVGAVLVPIGLTGRWGGSAQRSTAAVVGCLGAAIWVALMAATFLQYLLAYSTPRPISIGSTAMAIVTAAGWIGTAWLAARGRAGVIGRRVPVEIGATLIAVGGTVAAILYQLAIADLFRVRDTPLLLGLNIAGALGALGWWLVLVAAIRAEPASADDPGGAPEPASPSSIESP